ncbi:EAL domain-containing response regulator [Lysobacter sp. CA196]|uniref:EAL domain-containing response regulator n=1 Tax=Lysobacter sp. CA196 TaxID=3455606 RepID=UPI003F8D2483
MPGTDGVWSFDRDAEFAVRPSVILISGEDPRVIDPSRQFAVARGLTLLSTLHKPIESEGLLHALRRHWAKTGSDSQRPSRLPFDPGRIRQELCGEALQLAFQPKVHLPDRTLAGIEAVLRWRDPELWCVPPPRSSTARNLNVGISFNMSMRSLNNTAVVDRMADVVAAGCDRFDRYIVEVTETHLMREPAKVLESLIQVRLRGFRIAIDDCGVGAAAMQVLMKLPSNELKIDLSFVAAASDSTQAYELLVVELGLRLGQVVVAEGVETQTEAELVEALGCQQGQGYF